MRKQYIYISAAIACIIVATLWIHTGLIRPPAHNARAGTNGSDEDSVVIQNATTTLMREVVSTTSAISANPPVTKPQPATTASRETSQATAAAPSITEQKKTLYEFTAQKSETVLDAMRDFAKTAQFDFTTKEFPGLGAMIESINGLENGNGYYWILYINGKNSAKGASSAHVHVGDSIEWKYEASY